VETISMSWGMLGALAGTGIVSGLLAGMLGIGGGIVIVPVLTYVFEAYGVPIDVRIHMAVATSLATIIPTSIASLRSHWMHRSIDADLVRLWAIPIFVGAVTGVLVASSVNGRTLALIFGAAALVVAFQMLFIGQQVRISDHLPNRAASVGIAGGIGLVSALMGIGGGTLGVPILNLFSFPLRRAVGTASTFGLIIAVPATIGFVWDGWHAGGRPPYALGFVDVLGFLAITPSSILCAPIGAWLCHIIDPTWLRRIFALFLLITAVRLLSKAL
jgi:uncharacterized membrane protein YfcA